MQISSVQLTIKKKSLTDKKVNYDEIFGPGGNYNMGDETVFLSRCYKSKLNFYTSPDIIVDLHTATSSWANNYNEKVMYDRGAILGAIRPKLSVLYIIRYAIVKRRLYKNNMSFFLALKIMYNGRKEYLKLRKYSAKKS